MSNDQLFTLSRVLPAAVFDHIAAVMHEVAQVSEEEALLFTNAALPLSEWLIEQGLQRFAVVISARFSGLLRGKSMQMEAGLSPMLAFEQQEDFREWSIQQEWYRVELKFDPTAIADFLLQLHEQLPPQSKARHCLERASQLLQPNDANLQGEFTLRLAEVLAIGQGVNASVVSDRCSTVQMTEDVLQQHIDQEQVFNRVATQIRQTQELSMILETAIQQVCSFLQTDRVVIYQFELGLAAETLDPTLHAEVITIQPTELVCGRITYEARSSMLVPRILNLGEGVQCFIGIPDYKEKYRKGATQAVDNIQVTYAAAPCLVGLLQWAQVQAKLVVPIVVQEELWGLLIAHQCSGPRRWQESETQFLRYVAELLAIAIYQTQLYSQLQQQAHNLERQVIERTQELHDALNAAQSASLAKTEFLASISHELRTPLTAIIGMSSTLLRLPTDSSRERLLSFEKQQDYLKIIRNSGDHLLEMINDILDLSQVEAGRTVLDIREFSLTQVVTESVRMLKDRAHQNGITLELELKQPQHGGVPVSKTDRFAADPRRIKQMLLNLLSNAIKFTPQGGRVMLRAWIEQDKAILQIEDTGIGIPEHQFPLLFKKFQQLDTSYHRQYEGTGLGLALTKQLVELHGGRIEVESTVDVGSTFTIWLPVQPLLIQKQEEDGSKNGAIAASQVLEGRVVLIENHERTATLICDLLTAAGHQVIWMIDGLTALAQIEILKPETVVVDTQLAEMSASEVLQQLRQNPKTKNIKVLVLAMGDEDAERVRWLTEGADECLTLPITHPEELLDKVTALMVGQS